MKRVLFIDRDGTLVIEPPIDYQLDNLEKLEFYPKVFQNLSKIVTEFDFEIVMVTNQDGLGTSSFPQEDFLIVHNKILKAFKNEGIIFNEILIDKSFPEDNAHTRKPCVGLLHKYIYGNYDLENSFVIGDRVADMQLAINLGVRGIFLGEKCAVTTALSTTDWEDIYTYLKGASRSVIQKRKTSETDITIVLNLDGLGKNNICTGLGFFNHMLEQVAKHGGMDLEIVVKGDLHVDEHHVIEDVAIALGEAFAKALSSKKGIQRYGFLLPMDDALAQVAIDFGGRAWLVWDACFKREKIGDMPTEMFAHFFKSFSDAAKCNLHIQVKGDNEHHKIEAIFKAFAKAIQMAVKRTNQHTIPSTKGIL